VQHGEVSLTALAWAALERLLLFSTLTLAITLVHGDRFHYRGSQLITRTGTWGGCWCT
jgi:hypothetical protein